MTVKIADGVRSPESQAAIINAKEADYSPGWCCFHCGELFTKMSEAEQHFGKTPDWEPECLGINRLVKTSLVELITATRRLQEERDGAIAERNTAQEQADFLHGQERAFAARFNNPKVQTHEDAWNEYHSMEGRALCAEIILKRLRLQNHGYAVDMATDHVCKTGRAEE